MHYKVLGWVIAVRKGAEWMSVGNEWRSAVINHEDPPHTLAMRMVFCDNENYAKVLLQQMQQKFPAKYADAQVVPVSIEMKEVSREEAEAWQAEDERRFRT